MEKEIWKSIKDFEGMYEVSNFGRVRSLDRLVKYKSGMSRFFEGTIMAQRMSTSGYKVINIFKKGKPKTVSIHSLVATAFIPKHESKKILIVNHKDGDKTNNFYRNLEWVTYSQNKKHAQDMGLHTDNISGLEDYRNSIKVGVSALRGGEVIKTSGCSRELAEWLVDSGTLKGAKVGTIARSIRKKMNDGTSYRGLKFKRMD